MAKITTTFTPPPSRPTSSSSPNLPPQYVASVVDFLDDSGISASLSDEYNSKDFYSDLIRDLLKTDSVRRGRISCVFTVLPAVTNIHNGLFGGAIGAAVERLATACARTVVAEDKQLFLGELNMSYLSAAPQNEVVLVDYVVRSGKNLSVVAMEFRVKESRKQVFTARATFYHVPVAKL